MINKYGVIIDSKNYRSRLVGLDEDNNVLYDEVQETEKLITIDVEKTYGMILPFWNETTWEEHGEKPLPPTPSPDKNTILQQEVDALKVENLQLWDTVTLLLKDTGYIPNIPGA